MDETIRKTLEDLLILAMEDAVSEDDVRQLNALLKDHPDRIRYAIRFLQLGSHLKQSKKLAAMSKAWLSLNPEDSFSGFLRLMAEYEKGAEPVPVASHPDTAAPAVPEPASSAARTRVSRFSLVTLFLSSAALFFILAYAYWG